jgi:hypothetical protein
MKSVLIKLILEIISSLYISFQFISFAPFFNIYLAHDNDSEYHINKFKSNNSYLSIYNNNNNNNEDKEFVPIASYNNSDILRLSILEENKNKTGIYMWTNILVNKRYIGSAVDLSNRLKNYYNISYLKREIKTNNSMIYKALLKYGYSNFRLDIIEICKPIDLIEREQYYLDLLKPEYNILKMAGSLLGFKHNKDTLELIRTSKLGRSRTESDKLAITVGSTKAQSVLVINNKTNKSKEFLSIRKAAEFMGLHHSYIAKSMKISNKYVGKDYSIIKK